MSAPNIFIPSNQQQQSSDAVESPNRFVQWCGAVLTKSIRFLLVIAIVLLPVMFVLGNDTTFGFERVVMLVGLLCTIVALAGMLLLLQKRVMSVAPLAPVFLLVLVVWGIVSGTASGDTLDAFWGTLGPLTVTFSVVLAALSLLPLLLQSAGATLLRTITAVQVLSVLVLTHTLVWYWFGSSSLSFGELVLSDQSLVGGFVDSAVYAGLVILFGLATLVLVPLRLVVQGFIGLVLAAALGLLFLVDVQMVWLAVAVSSAVTTVYVFLRRMLFQKVALPPLTALAKSISLGVFAVAVLGLVYGSSVALTLSDRTAAQFIMVTPSLETSLDITKSVYEDNLWLGVGPNRYEDAWRLHKPVETNQGLLWNMSFSAGHNYVISVFTTYGLVGGVLLLLFHLGFVCFGLRRLVAGVNDSLVTRYVMTTAFTGAAFLWLMTYFYMPSVTILLLAAALTGLTFAAGAATSGVRVLSINVVTNRIRGFVILGAVVGALLLTVLFAYHVFTQYVEETNGIMTTTTQNDEIAAREANQRIAELNNLIATANPDSVTQEDLLEASRLALTTAQQAIDLDPSNPIHHQRLASVYSVLGAIGVDGAYRNAKNTLETVIDLDPNNPAHHLATARILLAEGESDAAAVALDTAIDLKFNYTEAIRLQTTLAIEQGEIDAVIAQLENTTVLDPSNAVHWYQLGLLHAAADDSENSIQTLLRAIQLDPAYADARYLLAEQYVKEERIDEALRQLRLIQETNPDNAQLQSLIANIEQGADVQFGIGVPGFESTDAMVDSEPALEVPSAVSTDQESGADSIDN